VSGLLTHALLLRNGLLGMLLSNRAGTPDRRPPHFPRTKCGISNGISSDNSTNPAYSPSRYHGA